MFKVAIAGCANVGKTSLFNLLTGKKNKIGNWEGVTVDISNSKMLFSKDIYIFDLPGITSLTDHEKSIDQITSREFLINHDIDLIVNVVTLENIRRDLQLSIELYELGKPIIIVLLTNRKTEVELELFNLEFINLNLSKKGILRDLIKKIQSICYDRSGSRLEDIERHRDIMDYNTTDPHEARKIAVEKIISGIDLGVHRHFTELIDKVIMHRFLSIPIFIINICAILFLTIFVGDFFKEYFEDFSERFIVKPITYCLEYIKTPSFITSTFAYGIGPGIKIIASFIPLLFILYIALGFLEESGYMTRISITVGRFASKIGLSGKSIIPLIVGFGCNVPAIMGTRIIQNDKQRLLTIILIPFMSCGARLTLFALFASSFFPDNSALVICCLYFFSIFLAFVVAMVLQPYFVQNEQKVHNQILPKYRLPRILIITKHTISKIRSFILDTGKTIAFMSVILYWLSVLPAEVLQLKFENINFNNKVNNDSIIANMSQNLDYIFEPIGITKDNWPAAVSLITGVIAKEVVASTLLTLYDIQEDDDVNSKLIIRKYFQEESRAFAYILFVLIYFPCITVFSAIKKEASLKVAIYSSIFYTLLAYVVAVAFNQISLNFNYSIPISLGILIFLISIIGLFGRIISKIFKKNLIESDRSR